jgi:hypothetical protein
MADSRADDTLLMSIVPLCKVRRFRRQCRSSAQLTRSRFVTLTAMPPRYGGKREQTGLHPTLNIRRNRQEQS